MLHPEYQNVYQPISHPEYQNVYQLLIGAIAVV
jgi:hypothetical protein